MIALSLSEFPKPHLFGSAPNDPRLQLLFQSKDIEFSVGSCSRRPGGWHVLNGMEPTTYPQTAPIFALWPSYLFDYQTKTLGYHWYLACCSPTASDVLESTIDA